MSATLLKVLGRESSINVRKVLWTLTELNLPYEREDWGQGFRSAQSPEFLALNPNGMVPVLLDRDADVVMWESNAICRYLAHRQQATPLLPLDRAERAAVEQWMDWQSNALNPAWRYAFLNLVRRSPEHQDVVQLSLSKQQWAHHMQLLDTQLASTGAYVTGATFTLADVVLGLSVHRWLQTPLAAAERPPLPAIDAYRARLTQRPGFARFALPEHN